MVIEMALNNIFYLGFYTGKGNPNNFKEFPSCNNKMNYIIDSLKSNNFKVNIFSLGESVSFSKSKYQIIDDLETITYVSTFPKRNILIIFSRIWLFLQIFFLLIFRVKSNDVVIVYHTYILLPLLKIIKKIKKINLIIEVEEIYSAAWKLSNHSIVNEIEGLKIADKYILINDLISDICNLKKPSIVCYGTYTSNFPENKTYNISVVNIVYAGIIEDNKSDVYLAIDSMKFLPSNYKLKIVGYGSEKNILALKSYISNINNVAYDGLLRGNEYKNYLHTCHIGLSPRLLEDQYSDYTFPSKVLAYISHGLVTVSSNIKAIKKSKVAPSIYFIQELTPQGVADTILSIDFRNIKKADLIKNLDHDFKTKIKELINDFS